MSFKSYYFFALNRGKGCTDMMMEIHLLHENMIPDPLKLHKGEEEDGDK